MAKTLAELVEFGANHARRVLLDDHQDSLTPIYHLVCPSGDVVVACPWDGEMEKKMTIQAVKHLARQHHATHALFVAEAWTIKRDPDSWRDHEVPSEASDRQEVVCVVATDGLRSDAGMLYIERDARGNIAALNPQQGELDGFGGRILDGIIDVPRGHA